MNILVAYGTIEGHTRTIAERIGEALIAAGHEASVVDLVQPGSFGLGSYDSAILCAPIHMGNYPAPFVHFLKDWGDSLRDIPTALVTVSLAIASGEADERKEAEAFPRKLEELTGFKADSEHNAAGALKYVEYDFLRRWVMRSIARKEGGPTDTTKDHVLTDWDALDAFVEAFAGKASKG